MFIHKVCSALKKAKVPFAVVGGYAVALHGAVRGTIDVDIVIRWSLKHLQDVESTFKKLGLVSRIPVNAENVFNFREEYIQNRNLIAWNFYNPSNPLNQIDIVINYDLKNLKHIQKIPSADTVIPVLSVIELIKMKKAAGRPQDIEDIEALTALKNL
jgi:hypothetical protein